MSGRWSFRILALVCLGAIFLAAGCSNGGGTKLRVMQASPDSGELSVLVDSTTKGNSIGYGSATDYFSVGSGSRQLQLEPVGSTTPVLQQTLSLAGGSDTTVIVCGFSSGLTGSVLTDDNSAPASQKVKLRFFNASPALGPADVYVVAPGTDITTVTPTVASLAFQSGSIYVTLPTGNYDVIFTPAGSPNIPLIDSGSLNLTDGQIRTYVALGDGAIGFTLGTLQDAK